MPLPRQGFRNSGFFTMIFLGSPVSASALRPRLVDGIYDDDRPTSIHAAR
jgi:hypothetical protein